MTMALLALEEAVEGVDLEAKAAQGQDGKGELPRSFFDTYSATANLVERDLKTPFRADAHGVRVDDTPVHQALREALVNTLIHADYTGQVSILVVKRPDMFGFRNPGTMRMPVDAAVRGGLSDCRNRRLQAMFRYVGLGEQAGSGLPKIFASWRQQEWRAPDLVEETTPYEQTLFQLRMASLWPAETIATLEKRFGPAFSQLSETQKLALVTVAMEKSVTHARLAAMTDAHPRDVTVALFSLVQKGMLESSGQHKRSFYFFPGERPAVEPQLEFMLDAANGRGIGGGSERIGGGFGADRGGFAADRGGVRSGSGRVRSRSRGVRSRSRGVRSGSRGVRCRSMRPRQRARACEPRCRLSCRNSWRAWASDRGNLGCGLLSSACAPGERSSRRSWANY